MYSSDNEVEVFFFCGGRGGRDTQKINAIKVMLIFFHDGGMTGTGYEVLCVRHAAAVPRARKASSEPVDDLVFLFAAKRLLLLASQVSSSFSSFSSPTSLIASLVPTSHTSGRYRLSFSSLCSSSVAASSLTRSISFSFITTVFFLFAHAHIPQKCNCYRSARSSRPLWALSRTQYKNLLVKQRPMQRRSS